jgi:putative SOS response-associated peptidase YedK
MSSRCAVVPCLLPFDNVWTPAILAKEDRAAWLTAAPDEAFKLLRQYPDTHMVATPVSKGVNTPKNNDAEFILPAAVA